MKIFCLVAITLMYFLSPYRMEVLAKETDMKVRIATGSLTGVYYSAGNAICRVLERRYGKRTDCQVLETDGTGANLPLLTDGQVDLAIAQADILLSPASASAKQTVADASGIKAIATLYPEVFQIVARRGLGVKRALDLVNHRSNLGLPNTGTRQTIDGLLRALNMSVDDFKHPLAISSSRDLDAFCNGEIDAFTFIAGVPNGKIALALERCGGDIVGFMRKANAAYVRATPGVDFFRFRRNSYPQMDKTVDTFAISAMLVARQDMEDTKVRRILSALLDEMPYFSGMHPAWSDISIISMAGHLETGLMHQAARAEYLDRRILPSR